MKPQEFIHELRRRSVLKVASIYAIGTWVVIQVADVVFPHLGIEESTIKMVIVLCLLGFPMALILAWFYKIETEKEIDEDKPEDKEVEEEVLSTKFGKRKIAITFWSLIGGISIVLGIIILSMLSSTGKITSAQIAKIQSDKIAVMIFENNTGDPKLDVIGKMASDWVTRGLIEIGMADVVSFNTVSRFAKFGEGHSVNMNIRPSFREETGVVNIIDGRYYLQGDSLLFNVEIANSITGKLSYSFSPQNCMVDQPLIGIEAIKQSVLGFWVTRKKGEYNASPPAFNAYQEYLNAKDYWISDYSKAYDHLQKAVQLDSNFLEPRFLIITLYLNTRHFKEAEEEINTIEQKKENLNRRQHNLLNYFKSKLEGDNRASYEYYHNEYKIDPKDLFINTSMAILNLEYINDPAQTIQIIREIDDQSLDYRDCYYCLSRVELLARALMKQKKYEEALTVLKLVPGRTNNRGLIAVEIKAFAHLGQPEAIQGLLDKSKSLDIDSDYRYLYYIAAREYRLLKNEKLLKSFGEQALDLYLASYPKSRKMTGRIYYLLGRYDEAEKIVAEFLKDRPSDRFSNAQMGALAALRGNREKAEEVIRKLESYIRPYSFGYIAYHQARIYTLLGEKEKALDGFLKALNEGMWFSFTNFQNDPDLMSLFDYPPFQEILQQFIK